MWATNLLVAPSSEATDATVQPTVYAMVQEQILSYLFRLLARRLAADGRTWELVPPLPVASARPDRTG
jgi:hypothetical protein